MPDDIPANEAARRKGRVIDQRQQQIDPAEHDSAGLNDAGPKRSQKQPGQDPGDSEKADRDA